MPAWGDIANEIRSVGSGYDVVRRTHLAKLSDRTQRNLIAYYSGILQKGPMLPRFVGFGISDLDKNGLMAACHSLDRSKGLDYVKLRRASLPPT